MSADLTRERLPAIKLHRLLGYAEQLGLHATTIIERTELNRTIDEYEAMETVSAADFCIIYKEVVDSLIKTGRKVGWTGGFASSSFRLLCRCIESAETLWEALERAEEFTSLKTEAPEVISFSVTADTAIIDFKLEPYESLKRFNHDPSLPSDFLHAMEVGTSLEVLHRLCCWLIGTNIEIKRLDLACSYINDQQHERMLTHFNRAPISYGFNSSRIHIPKKYLDYSLVNNKESMDHFLDTLPYQLVATPGQPTDISATIKNLIGNNFSKGTPSFETVAKKMGLSPSSLRRRLIKDHTSYQKIKDECRRDMAVDLLRRNDLSIAEISQKLGYIETGSFSRSFRHWTGQPPQEFRNQQIRHF